MLKKKNIPTSADYGVYETLDFEDINKPLMDGVSERFLILHKYLNFIISRIEGSILTLIESAINDKERREATKSLTKRIIWEEVGKIKLIKLKKIK